jgi:hypothetical protein
MDYTLSTLPDIYNINKKINKDVMIKEYEIYLKPQEKKNINLQSLKTQKYLYFITNSKNITVNYHHPLYNKCIIHLSTHDFDIDIANNSNIDDTYIKIFIIYKMNTQIISNNIYTDYKNLDNRNINIIFMINKYVCRCNKIVYSFKIFDKFFIKSREIINKDYIYINLKNLLFSYKVYHIYDNNYEIRLYKIINKKNNKSMIFNINIFLINFTDIFDILEEKTHQIYELLDENYIDPEFINLYDLFVTYKIYYIFGNSLELQNHDC